MKIRFHKQFHKKYQKCSLKLQSIIDKRIILFFEDPYSLLLNNHQLQGKFKNYRSINVTGDYRAVYKEISQNELIFVILGTHSQLYK